MQLISKCCWETTLNSATTAHVLQSHCRRCSNFESRGGINTRRWKSYKVKLHNLPSHHIDKRCQNLFVHQFKSKSSCCLSVLGNISWKLTLTYRCHFYILCSEAEVRLLMWILRDSFIDLPGYSSVTAALHRRCKGRGQVPLATHESRIESRLFLAFQSYKSSKHFWRTPAENGLFHWVHVEQALLLERISAKDSLRS